MNALGMIETYGYLAAVEALDSALKAANVSLVDVVRVKGGLVTVLIEGDVGAVKAAVDAARAAAKRVGTVVSVHVIPRPAEDVKNMLTSSTEYVEKKGQETLDLAPETPETEQTKIEDMSEEENETSKKERIYTREQMEEMTVANLRTLARELKITNMTSKEVRFAKKQQLIDAITAFTGQER